MTLFEKGEHYDAAWLNRTATDVLGKDNFTPEQLKLIKRLLIEVAAGYQRTISRQDWGIGWD